MIAPAALLLLIPWGLFCLPPMVATWQTRKIAKLLKDMGLDLKYYWYVEK